MGRNPDHIHGKTATLEHIFTYLGKVEDVLLEDAYNAQFEPEIAPLLRMPYHVHNSLNASAAFDSGTLRYEGTKKEPARATAGTLEGGARARRRNRHRAP